MITTRAKSFENGVNSDLLRVTTKDGCIKEATICKIDRTERFADFDILDWNWTLIDDGVETFIPSIEKQKKGRTW